VSALRQVPERLTTGSVEFDRILGGGIPARSVNVIAGQPGAGKTLFSLQMLFAAARQGRKGLYFTTLSEPSLKLVQYMEQFAFFDEKLVEALVVFADLGSAMRRRDADATLNEIAARVEREQPALVVIDSFKALREILDDPATLRTFVYDFAVHTAGWGATSLIVGEYTEAELMTNAEFAIADGIVRFSNSRHELTAVREVEVLKLRGADYLTGGHFFEIAANGLRFFPRVRSLEAELEPVKTSSSAASVPERVSTGDSGLDSMLGGGLPRASTSIILGGTGTGKTLLGLQFLLEGAARGEAGVHFTLEETPEQLRGFAHGLGWDLAGFEQRGLVTLIHESAIELSTDRFLDRARRQVASLGTRRAVLDSLTSLALGVPSERRFKELVYALAKHFRGLGITLNMNLEVGDLLGAAQLSGHGVSFAADNVIHLKYVELGGRLERGISVLKARGVRHATDVRRISVENDGVKVGAAFEGLRGVLTGLPVPVSGS
jgi:circadian clock protein KaiC